MKDQILNMISGEIDEIVNSCAANGTDEDPWDLLELNRDLRSVIPLPPITQEYVKDLATIDDLKEDLTKKAYALYDDKEKEFPDSETFREVERVILLRVIDRKWMDEIDDMEQLRQGIGLQAYGQRNPIDEYKMASYDMMDAMNEAIRTDTVTMLYRIRVEKKVEREEAAKVTGTNKDAAAPNAPKKRTAKKIYPNDPCPCGSGKKYKNCHGRLASK